MSRRLLYRWPVSQYNGGKPQAPQRQGTEVSSCKVSLLLNYHTAVPRHHSRQRTDCRRERFRLQPAHGNKRHAWINPAKSAPGDDPRLLTIRRQLVRCHPGQQDELPDLKSRTDFIRGTEQLSSHGICVHETLPFAQFFCVGDGVGLGQLSRCDFRHLQCPPESKSDSLEGFCLAGESPASSQRPQPPYESNTGLGGD